MSRLEKVDPKFFTEEWLEATKGAVAKWDCIVTGWDEDWWESGCTLCEEAEHDCFSCPLQQAHGGFQLSGCPHFDLAAGRSKKDARSLLGHLKNIQRQIEKGLP